MVCSRGDHVALLRRVAALCRLVFALAYVSACANAPAGDLTLEYGTEAGLSERRNGWMFVSRDSSRFDGGTLLYGEITPFAGGLAIIELDLPGDPKVRPVLRYQERLKGKITFEGDAVAGEIRVAQDLEAEDCGCSTVEFALLFESGRKQRFMDTAHLGLSGGRCAAPVRLGDLKGPVRIENVDLCAPSRTASSDAPPTSYKPPPDVYADDLCPSSDPYSSCSDQVGCVASDDESGCGSSEQEESGGGCESESEESSDASGCESDSTEAEGCAESDDASSDGCAEDDVDDADEAEACEGDDTVAHASSLRRRRVPGAWSAKESNAVTVACAMIVPWLRGRGARKRFSKR